MNLTDDQLAALAVQGMLPTWRKKLLGQEFDNLGQLAQWVATLNSQFQNMRRDTRFQKNVAIAEAYNPYLVDDDGEDDKEEEIAAAEWNWGKKIVMVPNPWGKGELKRAMISASQNQTNSLISCLRGDRSSCSTIMLYCLLIS